MTAAAGRPSSGTRGCVRLEGDRALSTALTSTPPAAVRHHAAAGGSRCASSTAGSGRGDTPLLPARPLPMAGEATAQGWRNSVSRGP